MFLPVSANHFVNVVLRPNSSCVLFMTSKCFEGIEVMTNGHWRQGVWRCVLCGGVWRCVEVCGTLIHNNGTSLKKYHKVGVGRNHGDNTFFNLKNIHINTT